MKMTVDKLIREYYRNNPDGHYFDRDTLKWFGETRSTMNVLKNTVIIVDSMDQKHECYVLSKFSKKYPGGPRRTYAYFDVKTLDDVNPKISF